MFYIFKIEIVLTIKEITYTCSFLKNIYCIYVFNVALICTRPIGGKYMSEIIWNLFKGEL